MTIVACALSLAACSYAEPDAGEEAVLISKPYFFGSGGVIDEPVSTGSEIIAWSTNEVIVSVTPTTFDVNLDNVMPKDGIPLDFQTQVRVQVTDSVELVKNWNGAARDDKGNESYYWFHGSIAPTYGELIRREVGKATMDQLAFDPAGVTRINEVVTAKLNQFIKANKMPVKLLSINIGRANPPENILQQRTETAAQQQRKLTMDAQKLAEDARRESEISRASADNAYRQAMSLSPEQYVELQRIAMQRQACQKSTCIFGNASTLVSR
jgi:regulator of protease activity HflC (stomatin/prohibitin superfamily)